MLRPVTIICATLAFTLVGLFIGHLVIEGAQRNSPNSVDDAYLFLGYAVAPVAGSTFGFLVAVFAFAAFKPDDPPNDNRNHNGR